MNFSGTMTSFTVNTLRNTLIIIIGTLSMIWICIMTTYAFHIDFSCKSSIITIFVSWWKIRYPVLGIVCIWYLVQVTINFKKMGICMMTRSNYIINFFINFMNRVSFRNSKFFNP